MVHPFKKCRIRYFIEIGIGFQSGAQGPSIKRILYVVKRRISAIQIENKNLSFLHSKETELTKRKPFSQQY